MKDATPAVTMEETAAPEVGPGAGDCVAVVVAPSTMDDKAMKTTMREKSFIFKVASILIQ